MLFSHQCLTAITMFLVWWVLKAAFTLNPRPPRKQAGLCSDWEAGRCRILKLSGHEYSGQSPVVRSVADWGDRTVELGSTLGARWCVDDCCSCTAGGPTEIKWETRCFVAASDLVGMQQPKNPYQSKMFCLLKCIQVFAFLYQRWGHLCTFWKYDLQGAPPPLKWDRPRHTW